jgi:hypothetical protein
MENRERIPSKGPFILILKEPGILGMLTSGYISITVILPLMQTDPPTPYISYMQDSLFHYAYFRKLTQIANRYGWGADYRALVPHGGAGRIALALLDGLHLLRKGGFVVMNPEGDARWDGLPLDLGDSTAWLGLHSGAPIVPAVCTIGAYEIWPVWQLRPFLRGRTSIKVGKPLKLTETPQEHVSIEDLKNATIKIKQLYEDMAYGVGGAEAWVGPILFNGKEVEETVQLQTNKELVPQELWEEQPKEKSLLWRGIPLLLWRCPVCKIEDALVHKRPWFRKQSVHCMACGTVWRVQNMVGNDFRMQLIDGPPDLIGYDIPLSTLFEMMKIGFEPKPLATTGVDLHEGEEVYLDISDVPLLPHKPNELFNTWEEREAPQIPPPGEQVLGDWDSVGEGRLLLTNQRLVWIGTDRELDFNWENVTAVHNWVVNTLGIRYVDARYRFPLGSEVGLKWITYAATVAKPIVEKKGRELVVSTY